MKRIAMSAPGPWALPLVLLLATPAAHASERARRAVNRVLRQVDVATLPTALSRAVETLGSKGSPSVHMRRDGIGRGAWDNRVRTDSRQTLYWQSLSRAIRDVRVIDETASKTWFAVGRTNSGTLDTWGHLSADGKRAAVTTEDVVHRAAGFTMQLALIQLGPTRVGFRYRRASSGSLPGVAETAHGVLRFSRPVSLAQLTVEAARQPEDFVVDYEQAPRLPTATNEETGRTVRVTATTPWVDLMNHARALTLPERAGPIAAPVNPAVRASIGEIWRRAVAGSRGAD